jgi:hypothetical protein
MAAFSPDRHQTVTAPASHTCTVQSWDTVYVMATAEHRERVTRDGHHGLGAPEGEIPPGDSSVADILHYG